MIIIKDMKLTNSEQIVPVLMYHSVLHPSTKAPALLQHLSITQQTFAAHLDRIQHMGYKTVTLDDLWGWKRGNVNLPKKAIVLTFDDGYLDNWIVAHPELAKRGMCATVFVNPTFVQSKRQSCGASTDPSLGYLSWQDLREMVASGVWSVESHTLTHDFTFVSPNIIDYHRPDTDYYWLYWLEYPNQKPCWIRDDWASKIPFGRPVFEFDRTLARPLYKENPLVRQVLEEFVREQGGAEFFSRKNWRQQLDNLAQKELMRDSGELETEASLEARVLHELTESKRVIEYYLERPVYHVCWPGGAYHPKWVDLALSVGYRSCTLSSRDSGANVRASPTHQVKRLSFSHNLGIWSGLPFHLAEKCMVTIKLHAISGNEPWKTIFPLVRRLRRLKG